MEKLLPPTFSGLPSLYNHELAGTTASTVLADLRQRLSVIQDAYVLTIPPPPVQGLGSAGGFKLMLQDRGGVGSKALAEAADTLVASPTRIRASPAYSRSSTSGRRLFIRTSIGRGRRRWGLLRRTCSRRYRSISGLSMSMTSTISAGPTR